MNKIAVLLLILISKNIFPQQWDWILTSERMNTQQTFSYGSTGTALSMDKSGNIFFGGQLSDSISLGDTLLVSNIDQTELMVIKFTPEGTPIWVKHTGGNNNDNGIWGITTDEMGNGYITGITNDTCYFDTIMVNANGGNSAFYIAKINPEGVFEWANIANRLNPWTAISIGYDIAAFNFNEIYVVGSFLDEIIVSGVNLTSYGGSDIFIMKYNQYGQLQWVRQAGGNLNDNPNSITLDTIGNIYITGKIQGLSTFGQFNLQTDGGSVDGFIAKLDAQGNFQWAKSFGGSQQDMGTSISYSRFGNIYLTGQIRGTAFFDNIVISTNGGTDLFIAKYDLNGNLRFVKGYGGNSNEYAYDLAINKLGNLIITGDFEGIGVIDSTIFTSSGFTDLFAAQFDYDGNFDWVIPYGTPLKDHGRSVLVDENDNVFVTGTIKGVQGSVAPYNYSIFFARTKNPITPVELTFFTANLFENKVNLNWSTATELNNHGFEVQRSLDKTNWATIGFREGKGTTSEPQHYFYSENISEIKTSRLYYRLKQIDFNSKFEYSDIVEVEIAPSRFSLEQNYPNPFNPSTKISWQTPVSGWQTLKVYDVLGNEVATLVNEYRTAGSYEIDFNASKLSSGVYYYQLKAGEFIETKKMIYLK